MAQAEGSSRGGAEARRGLSKTQCQALGWLQERGGRGVLTGNGRLLAAGEVAVFDASTWLRLVTFGLMTSDGPNRLRVSAPQRETGEAS